MFTAAFSFALLCTVLMCVGIILIKWVVSQVSVVIFTVILLVMSLIFLIVIEEKHYEE